MMPKTVSKDQYADELTWAHFELEPAMEKIVRLKAASKIIEADKNEPLKLLEVTPETIEVGIMPIGFSARVERGRWYPPVVIIEVTPKEYRKIMAKPSRLPNGWRMAKTYHRPSMATL